MADVLSQAYLTHLFPLCFLTNQPGSDVITMAGLLQLPLNNTSAGIPSTDQANFHVFPQLPPFLLDIYLLQNFQQHVLPTLHCLAVTPSTSDTLPDRFHFLAHNFCSHLPDFGQAITLVSSFTSSKLRPYVIFQRPIQILSVLDGLPQLPQNSLIITHSSPPLKFHVENLVSFPLNSACDFTLSWTV